MKENYHPLPELLSEAVLQRVRNVGPVLLWL